MIDTRFYTLIAHLWRGGKYGYYWTPSDDAGEKYTYWLTVNGAHDVPKLFAGVDAYFGVNPSNIRRSDHERAHNTDIDAINAFYCEYDCASDDERREARTKIDSLPIKPACIVSSGGGYQCYFWLTVPYLLDTPEARQHAADLQWAFAQFAGGDTSVNDLARVLRIPGTTNWKPKYAPNFPLVAIVEWQPDEQYDLAEIEALLQPTIDARTASKAHTQPPSVGSVSLSDQELLEVLFNSKNGGLYQDLWNGDTTTTAGDDHSKADQMLCNALAWITGRDIPRMDSLFRQSGLYRAKWDVNGYRERTLNNAANSAQQVYTPSQIDPDAVRAAQAAVGMNGNGASAVGSQSTQGAPKPQPKANKRRKSSVTYADIGRDYIRRNPDTLYSRGVWYRYDAGVWATIHDLTVEKEIWELLERYADDIDPSINGVNNVESFVRSQVYISEDRLDNDMQLINLKTGTYSLELQALLTHNKSRYLTTQLPFEYDFQAQAPIWLRYLETTFVDKQGKPDPELIAFVQETIGYSLTTDIRYHVTFWCYGEGANGKGVLFYILEQLAGNSAIPFNVDLLHREQYQLADLAGKRIALCPEADTNSMVEDAIIKALVAGDSLQVRQIRREPFTLRPTVKLWWSMNKLPTITDTSTGFWRRPKMIPFYADFENRNRANRIDDLKERLKDELPGIFNWAMEGLARLTNNGVFTFSKQSDDLTSNYREEANTIATFVGETCETDKSYNTASDIIYRAYRNWCTDNGYKPYNVRNFKVEMERLKYFWKRTNVIRVFDGLKLKGQPNAIP